LRGENGPVRGQSFPIGAEGLRIGRQAGKNQIVLDEPEISRSHARVWVDEHGRSRVENLSTTNGTYVNDRRIEHAELKPGDRVRFGVNSPCLFLFVVEAGKSDRPGVPTHDPASGRSTHFVESPSVLPLKTVVYRESEDAPPPDARFQLVLDQYAVRDIPLTSHRIPLGSTPGAGKVQIEHPTVSDLHAELIFDRGGAAVLFDRGSKNGTFVNGERIAERELHEGDVVQLGACDSKLLLYREARRRRVALRATDLTKDLMTVGRAADADVRVDHPTVSQHHAEIRRSADGYELIDRNSTNGTFVNGAAITRHRLQPRDRITIGGVQLLFDGSALEQQANGNLVRLHAYGLRYAPPNEPSKVLIQNVSLAIEPQEFIGLLGPSGAGKTTLMHALNGSQPAQSGRVLLNGSNVYQEYQALRSGMGYLPQEDILHRHLTVRQCLHFAGRLRLPDDFSEQELEKRIAEVLAVLELEERAELPILMLSGGQRKRVSLGIELLSKPALLFMDEPTAGQDPRTEMHLMRLFREITNRGATIVCTTHLLGSFSLLDKIAVLVGGRLAYFGPSQEMLAYFRASRPHEVYDRLQTKSPEAWEGEFQSSQVYRDHVANPLGDHETPAGKRAAPRGKRAAGPSLPRQFTTLLERQLILRLGDWRNAISLLAPPLFVALLAVALKAEPNDPTVLFMMVFTALYFSCSVAVGEIVNELPVYRRERRQNLSIVAYLGAKCTYMAGVGAAQSLIFMIVLTACHAQTHHFLAAFGLMALIAFQGGLIGLLLSAMFRTPEKSLFLFPLVMIVQLMLAGLLRPVESPRSGFFVRSRGGAVSVENLQATPGGMSPAMQAASSITVARWGLESLADLYIHDFDVANPTSTENAYSGALLNSITVTFHRGELAKARRILIDAFQPPGARRGPPGETGLGGRTAIDRYLAVHAAFILVMVGLIAVALKSKDGS
jgi:ABC-type multidrug transport system ATPase subunit/pSer/pThr/pTyr-binding forkhead associated (FHA) protein